MKHEDEGDTKCNWCAWNEGIRDQRKNQDHLDHSTIKIC